MGEVIDESEINTFADVMRVYPNATLQVWLRNPKPVDQATFLCIRCWMRPATITSRRFAQVAVDSGILKTVSEVYRKVKEGGMKWNGRRVTDPNLEVSLIWPGWGVVQLGKSTFQVVIKPIVQNRVEVSVERNDAHAAGNRQDTEGQQDEGAGLDS